MEIRESPKNVFFASKKAHIRNSFFKCLKLSIQYAAIDEGHFRITYSEDRLINLFKRRQSPVNEWLYENEITLGDLHNAECAPLYAQFSDWCLRNGYQRPMTAFSFKEEIRSIFDLEIKFENCGAGSRQFYFKRGNFDPKFRPFQEDV